MSYTWQVIYAAKYFNGYLVSTLVATSLIEVAQAFSDYDVISVTRVSED